MGVSKLIINGTTRFDITSDTVASSNLLSGYTAHGADGNEITGVMEETTALTAQQIESAVQAGWV